MARYSNPTFPEMADSELACSWALRTARAMDDGAERGRLWGLCTRTWHGLAFVGHTGLHVDPDMITKLATGDMGASLPRTWVGAEHALRGLCGYCKVWRGITGCSQNVSQCRPRWRAGAMHTPSLTVMHTSHCCRAFS